MDGRAMHIKQTIISSFRREFVEVGWRITITSQPCNKAAFVFCLILPLLLSRTK